MDMHKNNTEMQKADLALQYFIRIESSGRYHMLTDNLIDNPWGGVSRECGRGYLFGLKASQWTDGWVGSAVSAVSLL